MRLRSIIAICALVVLIYVNIAVDLRGDAEPELPMPPTTPVSVRKKGAHQTDTGPRETKKKVAQMEIEDGEPPAIKAKAAAVTNVVRRDVADSIVRLDLKSTTLQPFAGDSSVCCRALRQIQLALYTLPSDIQNLLPILHAYLREPDIRTIVEAGSRLGSSTQTMLHAMRYDMKKRFATVDLEIRQPIVAMYKCEKECTEKEYPDRTFFTVEGNDLQVKIPFVTDESSSDRPIDLMFIDTLHNGDLLMMELKRFPRYVRKYLVFHDTHSYTKHDEAPHIHAAGFPKGVKRPVGLQASLKDFLMNHPEWEEEMNNVHNNGFYVLRRREVPAGDLKVVYPGLKIDDQEAAIAAYGTRHNVQRDAKSRCMSGYREVYSHQSVAMKRDSDPCIETGMWVKSTPVIGPYNQVITNQDINIQPYLPLIASNVIAMSKVQHGRSVAFHGCELSPFIAFVHGAYWASASSHVVIREGCDLAKHFSQHSTIKVEVQDVALLVVSAEYLNKASDSELQKLQASSRIRIVCYGTSTVDVSKAHRHFISNGFDLKTALKASVGMAMWERHKNAAPVIYIPEAQRPHKSDESSSSKSEQQDRIVEGENLSKAAESKEKKESEMDAPRQAEKSTEQTAVKAAESKESATGAPVAEVKSNVKTRRQAVKEELEEMGPPRGAEKSTKENARDENTEVMKVPAGEEEKNEKRNLAKERLHPLYRKQKAVRESANTRGAEKELGSAEDESERRKSGKQLSVYEAPYRGEDGNGCCEALREIQSALLLVPSDIQNLLPILHAYLREPDIRTIVEAGSRLGSSTQTMLHAMRYDMKKRFATVDLEIRQPIVAMYKCEKECTEKEYPDRTFFTVEGNDLQVKIPFVTDESSSDRPIDLMFIDTLHNGDLLMMELKRFPRYVRKYLVFHDTHSFRVRDEDQRYSALGFPKGKRRPVGLQTVLKDFLMENEDWEEEMNNVHNNGLYILRRKKYAPSTKDIKVLHPGLDLETSDIIREDPHTTSRAVQQCLNGYDKIYKKQDIQMERQSNPCITTSLYTVNTQFTSVYNNMITREDVPIASVLPLIMAQVVATQAATKRVLFYGCDVSALLAFGHGVNFIKGHGAALLRDNDCENANDLTPRLRGVGDLLSGAPERKSMDVIVVSAKKLSTAIDDDLDMIADAAIHRIVTYGSSVFDIRHAHLHFKKSKYEFVLKTLLQHGIGFAMWERKSSTKLLYIEEAKQMN